VNCPNCNLILPWSADELEDGEIIECPDCEEELEAVHLEGGGVAFEAAGNWDDYLDDGIEWGGSD
jgi:hypothetical protein